MHEIDYSDTESLKPPLTPNALPHDNAHFDLESIVTPESNRYKRPRTRFQPFSMSTELQEEEDEITILSEAASPNLEVYQDWKDTYYKRERSETVRSDETLFVPEENLIQVGKPSRKSKLTSLKRASLRDAFWPLGDAVISTMILPLLSIEDASQFRQTHRRFYHLEFVDFRNYSSVSDLLQHILFEQESIRQKHQHRISTLMLQRLKQTWNQPPFNAMSQDETELFINIFVKLKWDEELIQFINGKGMELAGKPNMVSHRRLTNNEEEDRLNQGEARYNKEFAFSVLLDAVTHATIRYQRPQLLNRLVESRLSELRISQLAEYYALPSSPLPSLESQLVHLFKESENMQEPDFNEVSILALTALLSRNTEKINQALLDVIEFIGQTEPSDHLKSEMTTQEHQQFLEHVMQGTQEGLNKAVCYLVDTFRVEAHYPEPTGSIPSVCTIALTMNRLDLLQAVWSVTERHINATSSNEQLQEAADYLHLLLDAAVKKGRVEIFDYFWSIAQDLATRGAENPVRYVHPFLSGAIQYGRLEMSKRILSMYSILEMAKMELFVSEDGNAVTSDPAEYPMDIASLEIFQLGITAIQSANDKMIRFVFSNAFVPDVDVKYDVSTQISSMIRRGASRYLVIQLMKEQGGLWIISSDPMPEWLLAAAEGNNIEVFDYVHIECQVPITRQVLEKGREFQLVSSHALELLGNVEKVEECLRDDNWSHRLQVMRDHSFTRRSDEQTRYLGTLESLVDMYSDVLPVYPLPTLYLSATWLPQGWIDQGLYFDILGMLVRKDYVNLSNQVLGHMVRLNTTYPAQEVLGWLLKQEASHNMMDTYLRIYGRTSITDEEMDLALDAFYQYAEPSRANEVMRLLSSRNPARSHTLGVDFLLTLQEQQIPLDDDSPFEVPF